MRTLFRASGRAVAFVAPRSSRLLAAAQQEQSQHRHQAAPSGLLSALVVAALTATSLHSASCEEDAPAKKQADKDALKAWSRDASECKFELAFA